MTATMILKEIEALPPGEKAKLFRKLGRDTNGFSNGQRIPERELLQMIERIGRRLRTALTAEEMRTARLEGRK